MPGTRVPLARSGIGLAVRAGAPKPDISSAEALRQALLKATSVAYSASVSGRYVSTELFQRLGIAEQMAAQEPADRPRAGGRGGRARRGRDRLPADERAARGAGHRLRGPVAAGGAARQRVLGRRRRALAERRCGAGADPVSGVARGCADRVEDRSRADGGRTGPERARRPCREERNSTPGTARRATTRPARGSPRATRWQRLSPARILRTLDFGTMMSVAYPLKRPEREALAAFRRQGRRRTRAAAERDVWSGPAHPGRRRWQRAGPAGAPRRTTRAFNRGIVPA